MGDRLLRVLQVPRGWGTLSAKRTCWQVSTLGILKGGSVAASRVK